MAREARSIDLTGQLQPPLPAETEAAADARTPDDMLERVATIVKTVYILCAREVTGNPTYGAQAVRHWDGGEDCWGTRRRPVWPRIAAHIIRLGASPFDYVRAQFGGSKDGKVPLPNTFLNAAAVQRYRDYQRVVPDRLRLSLDRELKSIRWCAASMMEGLGWDRVAALDFAVQDQATVRATALVRYCVAVQEGLTEVAAWLREQALLEYLCQADMIDTAWGFCVPEELRVEARTIRDRLLR